MALLSKWKEEDEAIEITKSQDNDEPDWKAVGSRRGSLSVGVDNNNNNNCRNNSSSFLFNQNERRPSIDNKQWGSFGGFQWEGPSIFDEDNNHITMSTPLAPTTINNNNTLFDPVFSPVPMVPSSPLESPNLFYNKHQRSMSFSMGQNYHPFHTNNMSMDDDLERHCKNALAPTVEEEEEEENDKKDTILFDGDVRTRSQSSSSSYWMNHHHHQYQQQYQRFEKRRPSLGFIPSSSSSSSSSSSFLPELSSASSSLLFQRRMSQPVAATNYTFPDIPNGTSPTNSLLGISSAAQHLSDRLENINLSASTSTPPRKYASTSNDTFNDDNNSSVGKGILLQRSDHTTPIFSVEFKSGRTDFYYYQQQNSNLNLGDLVIVEADRGKDIGKIASERMTVEQAMRQKKKKDEFIIENEMHVKRIYRQATTNEVGFLLTKTQDEQQALEVCLQKIKNRKLPMDVVDAEYQWDRRKLTFYFTAERRIDFRELVRELFKIYKTRIWMCSVNGTSSENQNDA